MIQKRKGRVGARGLAVLTAAPLLGLVPMLGMDGTTASADGPVQVRERRVHKPAKHKHKHKKRHKPGKGTRTKPGTFLINASGPGVPLLPGRTYNWPFAVTGKGPLKAAPAVLTANLPKALEFVSGVQNCSYASNTGTGGDVGNVVCQLGPVKPGQTVAGVITAKVSEKAKPRERISSTATVTWGSSKVTKQFPQSSVADTADVSVSKKAPSAIRPGEAIPYETTVHNAGPAPATNVTITSKSPADIVENDTACTQRGMSYVCSVGTLSAGESKTIHTKVKPGKKAKAGMALVAPSSVSTKTTELNLANNRASVRTKIIRPGAVLAGRPVTKLKKHRPGGPAGKTQAPAQAPQRPEAPTKGMRELPRTGAETGIMLDMSLGLVGAGLILTRLGRNRRREQQQD